MKVFTPLHIFPVLALLSNTTIASIVRPRTVSYEPLVTESVSTAPTSSATATATTSSTTITSSATPTAAYTLDPSFVITDAATTRTYDWTIAQKVAAPDGYQKTIIAINDQLPGPIIEANEGDTIVVNVQNDLTETTSIHWHGMKMIGTPWMDGVPGFSQCPIPAGGSFTYQFTIDDQYGTYWYHSHSATQYTDGLLGALIVHSPDEPLVKGTDYDEDVIIFLQDWYHDTASNITTQMLSSAGYKGSTAAPSPQSGLINGKGVFDCDTAGYSSDVCVSPDIPSMSLESEKTYRMRIINGGSHAQFYFSVDDHTLNVTETDGTIVVGTEVHRVPIHNGERYSALLTTSANATSFYARAEMNTNCFAKVDANLDTTALMALHTDSSSTAPTTSDWSDAIGTNCKDLDDSQIAPYIVKAASTDLTSDNVFGFSSEVGTLMYDGQSFGRFYLQNQTGSLTTYVNYIYQPFLQVIHDGGSINTDSVAYIEIEDEVDTADIIINNLDKNLDHPYHLHSFEFQIVGRGSGTLTKEEWSSISFNTTNPPRRDTTVVPGGTWAVLRIQSTNGGPGVWPLHCHIAWHLAEGFMGAVAFHPDAIQAYTIPDANTQLCTSDLAVSGASINDTEAG